MSEYFEFKFKEGKGGEAMLTYYHFCVVIFDYTKSYMHVASPGMVRKPCSYPWRIAFGLLRYCYK